VWKRRWARIADTEEQRPDPLAEFSRNRRTLSDLAKYEPDGVPISGAPTSSMGLPEVAQELSSSQQEDMGWRGLDQDDAVTKASKSHDGSKSALHRSRSSSGSVAEFGGQKVHSSSGVAIPIGPLAVDPPAMPVLVRGVSGPYLGPGK